MPSLPASTAFTDSAVTEGGFKTAITNQREFLADLLGTTGTKLNAVRTLGTLANDVDVKTGAYTVIAADMGKLLLCSGTFTVSLSAAATLGDGFSFIIENNGTGVITIDPNSTEQIDGVATKTLAAGDWCVVTCTGTGFNTFGVSSISTSSVQTAISGSNYDELGTYAFALFQTSNTAIVVGNNYSGSSLRYWGISTNSATGIGSASSSGSATSMTGTWKAMTRTSALSGNYSGGLFLRVA